MPAGERAERKYRIALVLYLGLGILAWMTLGSMPVVLFGRTVPLRLLPELVLGGFVLRTWVAMQAERIRRDPEGSRERLERDGRPQG